MSHSTFCDSDVRCRMRLKERMNWGRRRQSRDKKAFKQLYFDSGEDEAHDSLSFFCRAFPSSSSLHEQFFCLCLFVAHYLHQVIWESLWLIKSTAASFLSKKQWFRRDFLMLHSNQFLVVSPKQKSRQLRHHAMSLFILNVIARIGCVVLPNMRKTNYQILLDYHHS